MVERPRQLYLFPDTGMMRIQLAAYVFKRFHFNDSLSFFDQGAY